MQRYEGNFDPESNKLNRCYHLSSDFDHPVYYCLFPGLFEQVMNVKCTHICLHN